MRGRGEIRMRVIFGSGEMRLSRGEGEIKKNLIELRRDIGVKFSERFE